MGAADEHRHHSPAAVRVAVLTISDTRTESTDVSGALLQERLEAAGHQVVHRAIHRDEPALIRAAIRQLLESGDTDAVITTGGTGLARRDSTFEAIDQLLDKRLPGFGELFRMLSYEQVGAAAMLSRATAGTAFGGVIAALPGSADAVTLAADKLLAPELGHMVHIARSDSRR